MRRRLLISNLVLIGITLALLSFTAFRATARSFERFSTAHTAVHTGVLVNTLENYYAQNNSWVGVQNQVVSLSLVSGFLVTVRDNTGTMVGSTLGEGLPVDNDALLRLELTAAGQPIGTAYIDRSVELAAVDDSFSADLVQEFLPSAVIVLLLAVALGVLLAQSLTQPLLHMRDAAAALAQGRYDVHLHEEAQRSDEIGALGRSFNQMAAGLADMERLRRELIMNVSHDLRTPLTILKGYLDGLINGQIADRRSAEQAFTAMEIEVAQLLHLVNDLNQVTALDAGKATLNKQVVDMVEIIDHVITRARPLAEAKEIKLHKQTAGLLPSLMADPLQIEQMLFNLVENAIHHTPPDGNVTLGAAVANQQLCLTVQDNGAGIAAVHLPHIFERFYRADPARHEAGAGSGLGLAIVKGVAQAHGGAVTVQSTEARGSCFTVTLPLTPILNSE